MRVAGIPARVSSQAVMRLPCNNGLVSSTYARNGTPASFDISSGASAVPYPDVATPPAWQCVRTVIPGVKSDSPYVPSRLPASRSSSWMARATASSRA